MNDPRELEHLKNYRPSIDDLKMKSPALISEDYVAKAKYDEAVRQRDELREMLVRFMNHFSDVRHEWKGLYTDAEAAIKKTESNNQ